jgi:hypothetical protein
MNNCALDIKNQVHSDAVNIATYHATHKMIDDNTIFFPAHTEGKVKVMKGASEMAKRKVKEINLKYNSARYGKVASFNNGFVHGVAINIHVPDILAEALERKSQIVAQEELAREELRKDAKRSGEEYDDRYLFDAMPNLMSPSSSDNYDFAAVLDYKRKIHKYIDHRIKVLSNMANNTKADLRRIAQLKEARSRLLNDVTIMSKKDKLIENYFMHFQNDLDIINNILLKNPSLENLSTARKYLEEVRFITTGEENRFSPELIAEISDPIIAEKFEKFLLAFDKTDKQLRNTENEFSLQMLKKFEKTRVEGNEMSEEEQEEVSTITALLENIDDPNVISYWLLPIDGDSENVSPVQLFVRKIFDDAIDKKEHAQLQGKLLFVKTELVKKLKSLGFANQEGILGKFYSSVNYDIFKKITDLGHSRLIGKYSNTWEQVKNKANQFIKESNKLKYITDDKKWIKIDKKRRRFFDYLKNNGVNFIDIRRIPEFLENEDLKASISNLESIMGMEKGSLLAQMQEGSEGAEAHKKALIDSLTNKSPGEVIGASSPKRRIAEREYKKAIKAQLDHFYDFELSMEQALSFALQKEGVSSFDRLSEKGKNEILQKYYTESPLTFIQSYTTKGNSIVDKKYYSKVAEEKTPTHTPGTPFIKQTPSTLEYVTYLPTKNKHFDRSFETTIETDDTLFEAWELFSEALEYINQNKKYTRSENVEDYLDSLTKDTDYLQANTNSLGGFLKTLPKATIGRVVAFLKNAITTSQKVDAKKAEKEEIRIRGTVMSIDDAIKDKAKPIEQVLRGKKVNILKKYKPGELAPSVTEYFATLTDRAIPSNISLKTFIREIVREEIYDNQKTDLIDTLVSQLDMVHAFKAKKEVITTLEYAKNLIKRIGAKDGVSIDSQISLVDEFINRHLYGINNRANWGKTNIKARSTENKKKVKLYKKSIVEIEKSMNSLTLTKEEHEQAEEALIELQAAIDNGGRELTVGSVSEAIFIRLQILGGLGFNLPSQMINAAIGNLAGKQNDGVLWTEGNFNKATSYSRKWKIGARTGKAWFGNTLDKENHIVTNTLLNTVAIFQNSANEIDNMIKNNYSKGLMKFVRNPLHIVGEVEKTIQRPQILAALADERVYKYDENGEKILNPQWKEGDLEADKYVGVPVFDANNLKKPHPAFEMSEQGVLVLKQEFDNKTNRNTWLHKNSQEYVNLFGNSGKIPRIIAKINGDYRETSTIMAKTNFFGALMMTFKTWFPAYIQRRYGKKDGIITKLEEGGKTKNLLTLQAGTVAMYAAMLGSATFASPLIGIVGLSLYLGGKAYKKSMKQDGEYLKSIVHTLKQLSTYTNLLATPTAGTLKLAQQITDMVTPGGKRIIPNSVIDKVLSKAGGFTKSESETQDEYEKNQARMHFLLEEFATTLKLLSLKLLVSAIFHPDDDEEKKFKKMTPLEQLTQEPDLVAFYLSENLINRFASDVNLGNNPQSLLGLMDNDLISDIDRLTLNLGKSMVGDTRYKSGRHEGELRLKVEAGQWLGIPKGLKDMGGGFPTYWQGDWTKGDFIDKATGSDFKTFERGRKQKRKEYKQERREHYSTDFYKNWTKEDIEKKVLQEANKRYPSVKEYFNDDGTLQKGSLSKVKQYDQERAERIRNNK